MLPDGQPIEGMRKPESFNETEIKQPQDYKGIRRMKYPALAVQGWSMLANNRIQGSREEKRKSKIF